MKSKLLKKFDLGDPVAGGHLKLGLNDYIDFNNITLTGGSAEDYLIYVNYSKEEKKYRFEVYKKKE